MQTVEIDDDLFFYLQGASHSRNMTIGEILRLEVLPPEVASAGKHGLGSAARGQGVGSQPSAREAALSDYVVSPEFLSNRNVVDQFLGVLSFLYKNNSDKFANLEVMEGRKRKYFAQSEQELENSGTSVNPKRIPHSNFWVVTNNDTNNKKVMLRRALVLLGYSARTIRLVVDSLR
jgi:negative modulator of initiation of replication